ncbi:hypothetical protein PoB_000030200 [Plakobranchus ocellatus]|uniref:Uncharacterized protein n=1 Tax=Plakobranchus ocellatus TaxID=259542 RepID=A0AAV3XUE6_9GAST|nr:hypothetical protein PoB_000030200 [Plakobranchus ocellatus]
MLHTAACGITIYNDNYKGVGGDDDKIGQQFKVRLELKKNSISRILQRARRYHNQYQLSLTTHPHQKRAKRGVFCHQPGTVPDYHSRRLTTLAPRPVWAWP